MRSLRVRAVSWSFCLFASVSLFPQQAAVNQGVSLRGGPSTKDPQRMQHDANGQR
jgi:hypothetical protein